ncbi:MAG TPA: zf-TFIIB domain-containing protein [Sphingomicrobium sp.]|nr:zf-TFIIB domain-containing protein [Sphingomicrobium sp.]
MPSASGPMACPVDGSTLVMSERSGIEIDYCPQCRGVWLDRGELDKIIERSAGAPAPAQAASAGQPQPGHWGHQPQGHYGHQKPYKRRKSFLEELFD